jgi:hypothetical protein
VRGSAGGRVTLRATVGGGWWRRQGRLPSSQRRRTRGCWRCLGPIKAGAVWGDGEQLDDGESLIAEFGLHVAGPVFPAQGTSGLRVWFPQRGVQQRLWPDATRAAARTPRGERRSTGHYPPGCAVCRRSKITALFVHWPSSVVSTINTHRTPCLDCAYGRLGYPWYWEHLVTMHWKNL